MPAIVVHGAPNRVVGGVTYGVSKGVTIKSVKVCDSTPQQNCPTSGVISGLNWVIGDHNPALLRTSVLGALIGIKINARAKTPKTARQNVTFRITVAPFFA